MNLFGSLDDELNTNSDGGFDNFDDASFGDDSTSFGNTNNQPGFGNDFGSFNSSSDDEDFDSSFDDDNFDNFGNNNMGQNQNQANQDFETEQGSKKTVKTAVIAIVVGVILLVAVVGIGKKLSGSKESDSSSDVKISIPGQSQAQTQTNQGERNAGRVDGLMTDGNNNSQSEQHQNSNSNNNSNNTGGSWTMFDGNANISFETQKRDLVFTVSGIRHYVATVDSMGTLVVKSTLTGSLSGMAGTYYLDVPYSKGIKLVVGDEFAVHVQMGTYNGKSVVGEISF